MFLSHVKLCFHVLVSALLLDLVGFYQLFDVVYQVLGLNIVWPQASMKTLIFEIRICCSKIGIVNVVVTTYGIVITTYHRFNII